MFRRVLIANRGEIAARVARTLQRLGVEAVMVYSEADARAPWLEAATARVCLGPAPASRSYLDMVSVVQAGHQTFCQAVHPGYGFLAENPRFALMADASGLTFVGPRAKMLSLMGDKARARETMARLGVEGIPGSRGRVATLQEAAALAREVGYPILLKASAGGGGKGMRLCENPERLEQAFREASLEASKAFGDPGLYIERYVRGGRHIEFQVLGDRMGEVIHLGERECSIQRNHQKLVEESPSPALSPAERRATGQRVAAALRRIGYDNAGTVEFLRSPEGGLYFMEMNTRLQVEHPVTEMVTGTDLVEAQLRVACGEPVPWSQDEVGWTGHAVEFRINAEDPDAGFRPDPGEIRDLQVPERVDDDVRVRWDAGIRPGARIPPHYDSLVGKLIVWGKDRATALAAAREVLDATVVEGVRTTLPLHRRIVRDPDFVSGNYDIQFLDRWYPGSSGRS